MSTRALITTAADDLATGVSTTWVTTVDTVSGIQTGATVTLSGVLASGVGNPLRVLVSTDETRAFVTTYITTDRGFDWRFRETVLKVL